MSWEKNVTQEWTWPKCVYIYRALHYCKMNTWNVPVCLAQGEGITFFTEIVEWFDVCGNWVRLDPADCPAQSKSQAPQSSTINKTRHVSIIHRIHPGSLALVGRESGEILFKLLNYDSFSRQWPLSISWWWCWGMCVVFRSYFAQKTTPAPLSSWEHATQPAHMAAGGVFQHTAAWIPESKTHRKQDLLDHVHTNAKTFFSVLATQPN